MIGQDLINSRLWDVMTNEEKRAVGGLKKIEVKEEQFKAQHDELLKAFSECGIDADKCNIYDKKYVEYYSAEDFKDLETNFSKDNFALNIKIKAIDRAIIDILKKDPQTPIEALAKSVNKTVAQTKRALNRLVKEGAIKKSDIKVSKDAEIGENTVPSFEPTDDALDVIKEEAEKDYQMASGISEKVESTDSLFVISRARLPWLLIGMLGGILGAYVIGMFEGHIRENAVMASFIPLILAMGGNVGVQSSAIIVQSLANNTLNYDSIAKKMLKELLVALFNGLICSFIALIFCWITKSDFDLALTIGVSLVAVFTYAGLFGTFVPLVLNKYDIDPALATGPFITTTNDIIGLLIYFLIGWALYF